MTARTDVMAAVALLLSPAPLLDILQRPWSEETWFSVLALALIVVVLVATELIHHWRDE